MQMLASADKIVCRVGSQGPQRAQLQKQQHLNEVSVDCYIQQGPITRKDISLRLRRQALLIGCYTALLIGCYKAPPDGVQCSNAVECCLGCPLGGVIKEVKGLARRASACPR